MPKRKIHFWLREESREGEQRTPLTPEDAQFLLQDPNYKITVEKSSQRCFPIQDYEKAGCEIAPSSSWINLSSGAERSDETLFILGLKELPVENQKLASNADISVPHELSQRHITFAHCYKNQHSWKNVLGRWVQGNGGELIDLEFLNDDSGRRVAAFGNAAGFAGMALGLLAWSQQQQGVRMGPVKPYDHKDKLIAHVKAELAKCSRLPHVLVLGAKGRCGSGSIALAQACGITQLTEWDMEETKSGGPFNEFLDVDILVNDIYLTGKVTPYLTTGMISDADGSKSRKLSVFVDVSCDVSNRHNPFPLVNDITSFVEPTKRIIEEDKANSVLPLDVIAIDHLPSLIPRESSQDFSKQLINHLKNMHLVNWYEPSSPDHDSRLQKEGTAETRVWTRARTLYAKKCEELAAQSATYASAALSPPNPDNKLLKTLYPPIQPYEKGFLKVTQTHNIYYELSGNPNGNPVVVLHGGPGGGCHEFYRQYFDPQAYKIIIFDQRGAGKSTPFACLEENTTWDLVNDIELLRKKLNVEKLVVFGGSWGSTLAIAYAETHPSRVKALILRGIFLLRRAELEFFYQEGSSWLFPDAWDEYLSAIPPAEHGDLMSAYHRRLTNDKDPKSQREAAAAWTKWEMATSRLYMDPENLKRASDTDGFALAFARIECHYFVNAGFFREDGQLLKDAHILKNIPGVIVQGRYDVVCPMKSAWELHKQWPKSELIIVPDSGHSMKEPGILSALVHACDKFKNI